jgi:hypothetical protein
MKQKESEGGSLDFPDHMVLLLVFKNLVNNQKTLSRIDKVQSQGGNIMKRFKKFFAAVITFALVLGMVGVMPGMRTMAAEGDEGEVTPTEAPVTPTETPVTTGSPAVTYDYSTGTILVTSTGAKFVYVGIAKNDAVKAYDVFQSQGNNTSIDISSFGVKKDLELWVYTDTDTKAEKLKITANPVAKLKMSYVPNGKLLDEQIIDKDAKTALSKLEFRISGEWLNIEALTADLLDTLTAYGSTIYFRVMGSANVFPSAEAKLKIGKKANAPKVVIDGAKMTIKFPKDIEILKADGSWDNKLIAAAGETINMSATDFGSKYGALGTLTKGISFAVRSVATDKKATSKIAIVELAGQLSIDDATTKIAGKVTVSTEKDSKGITKFIKVKNGSSVDIEYFIADKADATTTDKWIKLAVGKEASLKKENSEKFFIFRIASVKDEVTKVSSLPSEILAFVQLPKWETVAATPTTTPAATPTNPPTPTEPETEE